jgi:hypothetical protein
MASAERSKRLFYLRTNSERGTSQSKAQAIPTGSCHRGGHLIRCKARVQVGTRISNSRRRFAIRPDNRQRIVRRRHTRLCYCPLEGLDGQG